MGDELDDDEIESIFDSDDEEADLENNLEKVNDSCEMAKLSLTSVAKTTKAVMRQPIAIAYMKEDLKEQIVIKSDDDFLSKLDMDNEMGVIVENVDKRMDELVNHMMEKERFYSATWAPEMRKLVGIRLAYFIGWCLMKKKFTTDNILPDDLNYITLLDEYVYYLINQYNSSNSTSFSKKMRCGEAKKQKELLKRLSAQSIRGYASKAGAGLFLLGLCECKSYSSHLKALKISQKVGKDRGHLQVTNWAIMDLDVYHLMRTQFGEQHDFISKTLTEKPKISRHGTFKSNKDEKESKKIADYYSPIIDKVIEDALSQSFSSNFIHSFMSKLFSAESSIYETVRCAYLSTSTFQPAKFYKQLKKLLVEKKEKKNIKFYDSRPALNELLGDVKKMPEEFVGIFNVSDSFDKKFFKKFVDFLLERSQKAVLIFVTMFNLGEESSLGFLGIPAYTSSIFDQKNFVQHVQNDLLQTPLCPTTIEKELCLYDKFHRSDRILLRRLKLHLVKFATSNKEDKLCHLLKKLQYELGIKGKLELSLKNAYENFDPEKLIKPFEAFEDYLHITGDKKSDKLKGFLNAFKKAEKENAEEQEEIYDEMVDLICNEWVPEIYETEKLKKGCKAVIEDCKDYPAQNVVDNLDNPELKDYKLVYEMIFDIAYENRPIPYREILERFEDVKRNGDVPEYVKEYSIEYYFRVILDSLAYCGIIERKADNPELIKFFPTPSFNVIKKQIQSCDME